MKSILDPSFKYRASESHGTSDAFRKRQAARVRIAQGKKRTAAPVAKPEVTSKVSSLPRRTAK